MTTLRDFPAWKMVQQQQDVRCRSWSCGPACPDRQRRERFTPAYQRGVRAPGFGKLGQRKKI